MTKYTEDHVWVEVDGDHARIGITLHAQEALGDIVFVDLPAIGKAIAQKETAGVVESVKAASDIYTPVSGEIVEINTALQAAPDLINSSPLDAGWLYRIKLTNAAELDGLLDEKAYAAVCE